MQRLAVKNIFIGRRIVGLSLSSLSRASEHFAVLDGAKLRYSKENRYPPWSLLSAKQQPFNPIKQY